MRKQKHRAKTETHLGTRSRVPLVQVALPGTVPSVTPQGHPAQSAILPPGSSICGQLGGWVCAGSPAAKRDAGPGARVNSCAVTPLVEKVQTGGVEPGK